MANNMISVHTSHINTIKAGRDLLYGVLGDHFSPYPDCEYRFSAFADA